MLACTARRREPGRIDDDEIVGRVRFLHRPARVAPDEQKRARAVLDDFFDSWSRKNPERYGDFSPRPDPGRPLMIAAGRIWGDGEDTIPRPTPSSMRSVDAECEARLLNAYLGQET